ncbi:MAG: Nif3-like dinuclear metal center hexameric protein [Deferrisomatales bacterium]
MAVTLAHVAGAIEELAPLDLAEPWDRVGLQVGDPGAAVDALLVALDPSPRAVEAAVSRRAQLLVTHHPLLLHPLERIDLSTPRGRLVARILREGLAVYTAHTNLDKARGGVNDALAARLDLGEVCALGPGEPQLKLVVTVPVGYEARVLAALAAAGAGTIGPYAGCAFGCRGVGRFTPLAGARPFVGTVGRQERADEVRLETVVPRSRLGPVRQALLSAHPYETVALDLYPLQGDSDVGGLGRVGRLAAPRPLGEWAREVAQCLDAPGARLVGDPGQVVSTVAVCGGSGADLWPQALARGAQVLVTGDVKYHTALDAAAAGLALLDVGHGPSEREAVRVLGAAVRSGVAAQGEAVVVDEFYEPDPFSRVCP